MNKKETICISCKCESPRLIHNIRYQNKDQRLCTSCVLFTCKEFYCPTCYGVHGLISEGKLVQCKRCKSKSHPACFSADPDSKVCPSCEDPKRLIFAPKELRKTNGVKVMDVKASLLLLTAAQIGCLLMAEVWEEKKCYALVQLVEALNDRKKAKSGVARAMKDADLKNKDRTEESESLLDFSDSEDDDDDNTCSEASNDIGRMQKLTIGGEYARVEIDLNKECAQGE